MSSLSDETPHVSSERRNPKEKTLIIPEPVSDLTLCIISPFFHHSFSSLTISFLFSALASFFRDKAPGQRECDSSIDNINKCIRDIEQASLAVVSQNLPSRDDISLEVNGTSAQQQLFSLFNFVWLFLYLIFFFSFASCFLLAVLIFVLSFEVQYILFKGNQYFTCAPLFLTKKKSQ